MPRFTICAQANFEWAGGAHHDNLREPRLVAVLGMLEVHEDVQVDDHHQHRAHRGDQDQEPAERCEPTRASALRTQRGATETGAVCHATLPTVSSSQRFAGLLVVYLRAPLPTVSSSDCSLAVYHATLPTVSSPDSLLVVYLRAPLPKVPSSDCSLVLSISTSTSGWLLTVNSDC